MTPKSTFDPDLPAVYWQLASKRRPRPIQHRRIAIALTPTSSDLRQCGVDRSGTPDGADADRRFVREHRKIVAVSAIDRASRQLRPPDLRNFEALYYYGMPPIVRVRIIASRATARPADYRRGLVRALRAGARRQDSKVVEALTRRWAASSSTWCRGRCARRRVRRAKKPLDMRATATFQCRNRHCGLPGRQRRLDGSRHRRIAVGAFRPRLYVQARFSTIDQARSAVALARLPYWVAAPTRRCRQAALVDALHDRREPEQREGEIEVHDGTSVRPVRRAWPPDTGLGGDAECLEIDAGITARGAEALAKVTCSCSRGRPDERAELPVEHGMMRGSVGCTMALPSR